MTVQATRLEQARKQKAWTQSQLAQRSEVAPATVAALESGKAVCVRTQALVRLADALGMTVTELFL